MAKRRKKATKRANTKKVSGKTSARKYTDWTKLRIQLVEKESPRRASTKAGKRFTDGAKFIKKHPRATAKEVFKNTSYRSDDAKWDAEREHVKLVRVA